MDASPTASRAQRLRARCGASNAEIRTTSTTRNMLARTATRRRRARGGEANGGNPIDRVSRLPTGPGPQTRTGKVSANARDLKAPRRRGGGGSSSRRAERDCEGDTPFALGAFVSSAHRRRETLSPPRAQRLSDPFRRHDRAHAQPGRARAVPPAETFEPGPGPRRFSSPPSRRRPFGCRDPNQTENVTKHRLS